MKTIKFLVLALLAIAIYSCHKDDDKNTESDFSVLGVSSVNVNSVTYRVNDNFFWITDGGTPFYASVTGLTSVTKHCTIEYVVLASGDAKEVSATSTYPDVLIAVSSATTTDGIVYKVIDITRPHYDEHLTYKIFFANIED